jgi:eukaryotic-like serine/threonine-protein kinase
LGKLAKARELTRRAVNSSVRKESKETAARWNLELALGEAESGNTAAAKQGVAKALALDRGRDTTVNSALILARAGDPTPAKKLTEELEENYPSNTLLKFYWLPTIKALLKLNERNPSEAISFLETVEPYELIPDGNMYATYIRGRAQLMAHNGLAASAEFQKILDHSGIVLDSPIGALARLQLGRAYAMQRETGKAKAAYQDFLTLWKDADPDMPVLIAAKSEYAKLK